MRRTNVTIQRRLSARYLGLIGVLTATMIAFGCQGSGSESSIDDGSPLSSTLQDDMRPAVPTMADIESALTLNATQRSELAAALTEWTTLATRRHEAMRQKARGEKRFGMDDTMAQPQWSFLAKSSEILTPDQFVELVAVVRESRDARMRAVRRSFTQAQDHRRSTDRHAERLIEELELTDNQASDFKDALEKHHEAIMALHKEHPRGSDPSDDMHKAMRQLREEFEQQLSRIMTEDQLASWNDRRNNGQSNMTVRRAQRDERREEFTVQRRERRLERLGDVLDLTESQKSGISGILSAEQEKRHALLEQKREANDGFDAVRQELDQIRKESRDQIHELLDDDQGRMYDALESLMPRWSFPGSNRGNGRRSFRTKGEAVRLNVTGNAA